MSGTRSQLEKAIHQIQDKQPVPEIDFTQHQLDNGFTISTQERVVKEVSVACIIRNHSTGLNLLSSLVFVGASTCDVHPNGRTVLLA